MGLYAKLMNKFVDSSNEVVYQNIDCKGFQIIYKRMGKQDSTNKCNQRNCKILVTKMDER